MKKTTILGIATAVTAAFGLQLNTVAAADEAPTSAASFTVTNAQTDDDPSAGQLTLTGTPTFDFGGITLKEAYQGKNLSGKATGNISVSDQTASDEGWTLTATLGNFTGDDSAHTSITATPLAFTSTVVTGVTGTNVNPDTATQSASLTASDSTVLEESANFGQGTTNAEVSSTTLNLPASFQIKPATYTGNITWTLTGGEVTDPAA